jgi:hypothetical protein
MITTIQVNPAVSNYICYQWQWVSMYDYIMPIIAIFVTFGIILLVHRFKLVSKLWKWMESTKTPLWFIIAMVSSLFPLSILLITLPVMIMEMINVGNINLPSWSIAIVGIGLSIVGFLDIALAVWAYCAWKWDHFIPWMQRKTKKVSRNKHGLVEEL